MEYICVYISGIYFPFLISVRVKNIWLPNDLCISSLELCIYIHTQYVTESFKNTRHTVFLLLNRCLCIIKWYTCSFRIHIKYIITIIRKVRTLDIRSHTHATTILSLSCTWERAWKKYFFVFYTDSFSRLGRLKSLRAIKLFS